MCLVGDVDRSTPVLSSFVLVQDTTTDRVNCILRAPEGDAHYVNDEGRREWIPDGGTWFCEVDRGVPVFDSSRTFVDRLDDAGRHVCTT